MERSLKAVLCALLLVPVAAMAKDDAAAKSSIDLYYVPKADFELTIPGLGSGDDDGDGFGIRGLVRAGETFLITGEYQSVGYDDSGLDFDQIRLGGGFGSPTGFAGYVEYFTAELGGSGGDLEADGFGLHARLAGHLSPQFLLYGDLGYLNLEGEDDTGASDDIDGFEFTLGGAFMFSDTAAGFIDYRALNLETDESETEFQFDDLRLGVRLFIGA